MKKLLVLLLVLPAFTQAQIKSCCDFSFIGKGAVTPALAASTTPTTFPTSITATSFAGTAGGSATYTLSGVLLGSNTVVVTPVSGWEVSTDNTTFTSSLTLTPVAGIINQAVYARLKSVNTVASYNGTFTNNCAGLSLTAPVTATGTTSVAPVLSASPTSITALNGTAGTPGGFQTVTVTYAGATKTMTPPSGTEVSQNAGSSYSGTSNQTITGTSPLAVRIRTAAGTAAGAIAGSLVLQGSDVTTVNVSVAGTVNSNSASLFYFRKTAPAAVWPGAACIYGDPRSGVLSGTLNGLTVSTISTSNWHGPSATNSCASDTGGMTGSTITNFPDTLLKGIFYNYSTTNRLADSVNNAGKHQLSIAGFVPGSTHTVEVAGALFTGFNFTTTVSWRMWGSGALATVSPAHLLKGNTSYSYTFTVTADGSGNAYIDLNTDTGMDLNCISGILIN